MVDDTNSPYSRTGSPTASASSQPVAYCQECGRPLTTGTLHRVRGGIFCAPCASLHASQSWGPVTMTTQAGAGLTPTSGSRGGPSPAIAGLLGFIPGVGAMYNGQYAKGALHLIVFVVLVSMADNLNGVFYWLVWGWVFYQAFDAYHTAVARRDGMPLPNPFGWNDVGERFGFGKSAAAPPAGYETELPAAPQPPQMPRREYEVPQRPAQESSWAYAEPELRSSENPYAEPFRAATQTASTPPPAYMTGVPFTPTFTGVSAPTDSPIAASEVQRRFPAGAVWLIALGVVFLSGNLLPGLRVHGQWLVPVALTAVALWTAARRWDQYRVATELSPAAPASLAAGMTGPCFLLFVAFLLSLDAGGVITMHHSWPLLLVAWGAVLLVRRAVTTEPPRSNDDALTNREMEMAAHPLQDTAHVRSAGL